MDQPVLSLAMAISPRCRCSSLGAGLAIGIVGDAGVRANAQQPRLFVGMILILIFAEAQLQLEENHRKTRAKP